MSHLFLILFCQLVALEAIQPTLAGLVAGTDSSGITVVIRDQPFGLQAYVSTGQSSYAITGATVLSTIKDGLEFVSVNDDSLYGITLEENSFTTSYKMMDGPKQEALRTTRASFEQNLIGLAITKPKSHRYEQAYVPYKTLYTDAISSYKNAPISSNSDLAAYGYGKISTYCNTAFNYVQSKPAPVFKKIKVRLGDSGDSLGVGINNNLSNDKSLQQLFNLGNSGMTPNVTDSAVMLFDVKGCPTNIYSATWSVQILRDNKIVLFTPDSTKFIYIKPGMPYDIIWFLVMRERSIFVYKDGTVLAKRISMLDETELGLYSAARDEVKNIQTLLSGSASLFDEKDS